MMVALQEREPCWLSGSLAMFELDLMKRAVVD